MHMEIDMGGTVAKLVEEGAEITSLIVTDGGRASNPFGWTENEWLKCGGLRRCGPRRSWA